MNDAPWRRDALGGSDAPALVGVDPFRSAGDVWAEKSGRVYRDRLEPVKRAADVRELGLALEPFLLAVVAEQLDRPVTAQVFYRHPTAPLAATIDGLVLDGEPVLIQAKTCGLLGPAPAYAAEYGEDGSDEVPRAVLIQVHHELAVLDAQPDLPRIPAALVPVLIGGRGLHVYRVPRNDALLAELVDLERDWWERYVVADRCPLDDPPSIRTLSAWLRRPDPAWAPIDDEVVTAWRTAKEAQKDADKCEEKARCVVIASLADVEVGVCTFGRVTFHASDRAGYTVAPKSGVRTLRFKPAHPLKGEA